MSRKTEKLASLIRSTVGEAILTRLSDPRIDPARTSITRVEACGDLKSATVYISVAGDEHLQSRTMAALVHASGYLQDRLARRASLRYIPVLKFEFDIAFKQTMETFKLLSQVRDELGELERKRISREEKQDSLKENKFPE